MVSDVFFPAGGSGPALLPTLNLGGGGGGNIDWEGAGEGLGKSAGAS